MAKFKRIVLTELGETTEGYEWSTEKPGERFKFYTENYEYFVYANRKNPRALDISFGLSFEQAGMQRFDTVTNEKNMFKVVATVIDIAKHVWRHRESFYRDGEMIEYIQFDGNPKDDEKQTKDTTRNKLYLKFIKNQFPDAEISHDRKNTYRIYP